MTVCEPGRALELEHGDVVAHVVADDARRVGAPVPGTTTRIVVAPAITWLFVSTSPEEVSTMPVPAAEPSSSPSPVSMTTIPRSGGCLRGGADRSRGGVAAAEGEHRGSGHREHGRAEHENQPEKAFVGHGSECSPRLRAS